MTEFSSQVKEWVRSHELGVQLALFIVELLLIFGGLVVISGKNRMADVAVVCLLLLGVGYLRWRIS